MYTPEPLPQNSDDLPLYLAHELERLSGVLQAFAVASLGFEVHHVAPQKPERGRVYYADGSDWNPGAGEGLYLYTSSGFEKL